MNDRIKLFLAIAGVLIFITLIIMFGKIPAPQYGSEPQITRQDGVCGMNECEQPLLKEWNESISVSGETILVKKEELPPYPDMEAKGGNVISIDKEPAYELAGDIPDCDFSIIRIGEVAEYKDGSVRIGYVGCRGMPYRYDYMVNNRTTQNNQTFLKSYWVKKGEPIT